jgi:hypothetical protein
MDPTRSNATRIFCTPDGETHLEDTVIVFSEKNLAPPAPPVHVSPTRPSSGAFLAGFEAHWGASDLDTHTYHAAPAPMQIAVLRGSFTVTTSDGQARRFAPGDVISVEDASPCKGHISVVGDEPLLAMFVR